MWSVACIMYECLVEQALFPGISSLDQMERIIRTLGYPGGSALASLSADTPHGLSHLIDALPTPLDLILLGCSPAFYQAFGALLKFSL